MVAPPPTLKEDADWQGPILPGQVYVNLKSMKWCMLPLPEIPEALEHYQRIQSLSQLQQHRQEGETGVETQQPAIDDHDDTKKPANLHEGHVTQPQYVRANTLGSPPQTFSFSGFSQQYQQLRDSTSSVQQAPYKQRRYTGNALEPVNPSYGDAYLNASPQVSDGSVPSKRLGDDNPIRPGDRKRRNTVPVNAYRNGGQGQGNGQSTTTRRMTTTMGPPPTFVGSTPVLIAGARIAQEALSGQPPHYNAAAMPPPPRPVWTANSAVASPVRSAGIDGFGSSEHSPFLILTHTVLNPSHLSSSPHSTYMNTGGSSGQPNVYPVNKSSRSVNSNPSVRTAVSQTYVVVHDAEVSRRVYEELVKLFKGVKAEIDRNRGANRPKEVPCWCRRRNCETSLEQEMCTQLHRYAWQIWQPLRQIPEAWTGKVRNQMLKISFEDLSVEQQRILRESNQPEGCTSLTDIFARIRRNELGTIDKSHFETFRNLGPRAIKLVKRLLDNDDYLYSNRQSNLLETLAARSVYSTINIQSLPQGNTVSDTSHIPVVLQETPLDLAGAVPIDFMPLANMIEDEIDGHGYHNFLRHPSGFPAVSGTCPPSMVVSNHRHSQLKLHSSPAHSEKNNSQDLGGHAQPVNYQLIGSAISTSPQLNYRDYGNGSESVDQAIPSEPEDPHKRFLGPETSSKVYALFEKLFREVEAMLNDESKGAVATPTTRFGRCWCSGKARPAMPCKTNVCEMSEACAKQILAVLTDSGETWTQLVLKQMLKLDPESIRGELRLLLPSTEYTSLSDIFGMLRTWRRCRSTSSPYYQIFKALGPRVSKLVSDLPFDDSIAYLNAPNGSQGFSRTSASPNTFRIGSALVTQNSATSAALPPTTERCRTLTPESLIAEGAYGTVLHPLDVNVANAQHEQIRYTDRTRTSTGSRPQSAEITGRHEPNPLSVQAQYSLPASAPGTHYTEAFGAPWFIPGNDGTIIDSSFDPLEPYLPGDLVSLHQPTLDWNLANSSAASRY
ncbi:hypothetical protein QFC24_006592 [Naganishia onofrii]|uniref:Uncharacterized protein n=1 Tax=Naganishia onofrii TaxID=1851511 RepID=A0ACC2X056_9TREE|nr:hypothetical protein QFC24_006592 [Naganishia onofrii]